MRRRLLSAALLASGLLLGLSVYRVLLVPDPPLSADEAGHALPAARMALALREGRAFGVFDATRREVVWPFLHPWLIRVGRRLPSLLFVGFALAMLTLHPNNQERYLFTTLPVILVVAEAEMAHRLRRLGGRETVWPALAALLLARNPLPQVQESAESAGSGRSTRWPCKRRCAAHGSAVSSPSSSATARPSFPTGLQSGMPLARTTCA